MRVHYGSGDEQTLVIGNSVVRYSDTHVKVKKVLSVNKRIYYGGDIDVTSNSIAVAEGLCY